MKAFSEAQRRFLVPLKPVLKPKNNRYKILKHLIIISLFIIIFRLSWFSVQTYLKRSKNVFLIPPLFIFAWLAFCIYECVYNFAEKNVNVTMSQSHMLILHHVLLFFRLSHTNT